MFVDQVIRLQLKDVASELLETELTDWQRIFLISMSGWDGRIKTTQAAIIKEIYDEKKESLAEKSLATEKSFAEKR